MFRGALAALAHTLLFPCFPLSPLSLLSPCCERQVSVASFIPLWASNFGLSEAQVESLVESLTSAAHNLTHAGGLATTNVVRALYLISVPFGGCSTHGMV